MYGVWCMQMERKVVAHLNMAEKSKIVLLDKEETNTHHKKRNKNSNYDNLVLIVMR